MRIAGTLVTIALASACGAAPPVYYQNTDRTTWTIPLVDPEAPALVVEARIQGKGPYLFLLDPDSAGSVIDDSVATELGLYSNQRYVRVLNQHDVSVPRKFYEVLALDVGELAVRNVKMLGAPDNTLRAHDRRVHGIIGADLLTRTIVIHVDRDRGLVELALTGHQRVPEGAVPIKGRLQDGALYVEAKLEGDGEVQLQVRLASAVSTLESAVLAQVDAPRFDTVVVATDETGAVARLQGGVLVPAVHLDGLAVPQVEFFKRADQRATFEPLVDGVIGANLLSRFEVVIDRDDQVLWLAPRRGS